MYPVAPPTKTRMPDLLCVAPSYSRLGRCGQPGSSGSWLRRSPTSLFAHERMRFFGERRPARLRTRDRQPFLHHATVPGIEGLADARFDELDDARLRQLHHQGALGEEREELPADLETVRSELARALERGLVIGDDGRERGV